MCGTYTTPMILFALSSWWTVGWAIGGAVILIAALLLLTLIGLGRKIADQADDVTAALEGARANTKPMFELWQTRSAIERITGGLGSAREELSG